MSITVEKCLQAWTNSLKQMNVKADIVFFGDSLTYYGDFSSLFPGRVVCNLGLRGDTLQGLRERVEQVGILQPSRVYLMAGINDIASLSHLEFRNQYELLIRLLLEQINGDSLFVQSMLPVNDVSYSIRCNSEQIASYNKVISQISFEYNLQFLDLFSMYVVDDGLLPANMSLDGLHLRKDAYGQWYSLLRKTI